MQNDVEARSIDAIFASNQEAQTSIRGLEEAIERERSATDTVVEGMDPHTAANYTQLQEEEKRIEQVRTLSVVLLLYMNCSCNLFVSPFCMIIFVLPAFDSEI